MTSVWLGQARQTSRWRPTRIEPGSALMNSFGTSLVGEPARVVLDHGDDVGGLALDRDLARPASASGGGPRPGWRRAGGTRPSPRRRACAGPSRAARARRTCSWPAPCPRRRRSGSPGRRGARSSGQSAQVTGVHDRLHVDDAGDAVGVAARPLEAQRRAPVVQTSTIRVAERELVPQREQVVALLGVAVAVRAGAGELVASRPCRSGRRRRAGRARRSAA